MYCLRGDVFLEASHLALLARARAVEVSKRKRKGFK